VCGFDQSCEEPEVRGAKEERRAGSQGRDRENDEEERGDEN